MMQLEATTRTARGSGDIGGSMVDICALLAVGLRKHQPNFTACREWPLRDDDFARSSDGFWPRPCADPCAVDDPGEMLSTRMRLTSVASRPVAAGDGSPLRVYQMMHAHIEFATAR